MELLPPVVKLISPSRISVFQECAKKYDYIYNQELVPVGPIKGYFDKGNYFHELSHVYYQLIQSGATPGSGFVEASIVNRIKNDFSKVSDPRLLSLFNVITKSMIRFIKEQSPIIDKNIEVLYTEHELIYPTASYALFGYADLIYRTGSGQLRVRDHKTGEKAWLKADAKNSNQLLFYSLILYFILKEVPVAEISYINTKDSVKPIPYEKAYTHAPVSYSERELMIYFEDICKIIEKMLSSEPLPNYGNHCGYCQFKTPCYLSRKGLDTEQLTSVYFKRVSRESQRKHASFTTSTLQTASKENGSSGDNPNQVIFS